MNSRKLFSVLPEATVTGTAPKTLTALTDDSRRVTPGSCFVAVKGTQFDGHSAIDSAISAGAAAIVAETPCPASAEQAGICWVQVADTPGRWSAHERLAWLPLLAARDAGCHRHQR